MSFLARRLRALGGVLAFAGLLMGCSNGSDGTHDGAMTPGDLGAGDMVLTTEAQCSGVPVSDGQACGNGCGAGFTCAGYDSQSLGCYQVCDPAAPTCACGRRCVAIQGTQESACLPANGAGERCGTDGQGKPYGYGGACGQGLVCAGPPDARYCVPTCETSTTCAFGTSCKDVVNNMKVGDAVCWFNYAETGSPLGGNCNPQTFCATGTLCTGGSCRQQCGGPADPTCATGTCTPMKDGDRIFAYVCM